MSRPTQRMLHAIPTEILELILRQTLHSDSMIRALRLVSPTWHAAVMQTRVACMHMFRGAPVRFFIECFERFCVKHGRIQGSYEDAWSVSNVYWRQNRWQEASVRLSATVQMLLYLHCSQTEHMTIERLSVIHNTFETTHLASFTRCATADCLQRMQTGQAVPRKRRGVTPLILGR